MRVSLSVLVGMRGKARNRPIVSTLFATLLAREHPIVSSIHHLSLSLNSKKVLMFPWGCAGEGKLGFG